MIATPGLARHPLIAGFLLASLGLRLAPAAEARIVADVEFAQVGGHSLKLDLHLPASTPQAPLIVWVHGGAWRSGTRKDAPLARLAADGFAVASVDYRLSPAARFPAQVHDIKAAIRFLRAHAQEYGLNTARIAIAGASAGGHLAALVGVTNGHEELEGAVGSHTGQSSDVQAIISFYGAANLTTILAQSTPHGLSVRVPALNLLLGGPPSEQPELAQLASPVFHVDSEDPPLLLFHGDQDPQMPINQAHEITGAYEKGGAFVRFITVHGAAHGGPEFFDEPRLKATQEFLARTLSLP